MFRSLWNLIVLGLKAAIVVIVAGVAILAIMYACMGIGLLVSAVGKYFGWW